MLAWEMITSPGAARRLGCGFAMTIKTNMTDKTDRLNFFIRGASRTAVNNMPAAAFSPNIASLDRAKQLENAPSTNSLDTGLGSRLGQALRRYDGGSKGAGRVDS